MEKVVSFRLTEKLFGGIVRSKVSFDEDETTKQLNREGCDFAENIPQNVVA